MLEAYGRYMNVCRTTAAGVRDSDNWQKGIPLPAYMKSGWRHFFDWWKLYRANDVYYLMVIPILALLFNASGFLHELIKKDPEIVNRAMKVFEAERAAEVADRVKGMAAPADVARTATRTTEPA